MRASWLARRFPDLWKNENAVKMELRDLAQRGDIDMASLLYGAKAFQFREDGQRGRATVVWALDYASAQRVFTAMADGN